MRLRKIAGSISMFLIAAAISIFNGGAITHAADSPFELIDLAITARSEGVEGTAGLNTDGLIENHVTFHHVGDYVDYLLTLKNNDSETVTITSISDNNTNPYITYTYDSHENEEIAAGANLALYVRATYANEVTDLNDRAQNAAMKISVNYKKQEIIATGTTEIDLGSEDDLIVPNTGDYIESGSSTRTATDTVAIAMIIISATIAIIVCIVKRSKKGTAIFFALALAFTFVSTTTAEPGIKEVEADFAFDFSGSFNLYDKLAVSYDIDGQDNVQAVSYGATVADLQTPERQGYAFTQWLNGDNQNVSDDTVISDDLVLFPYWTLKVAKFGGWCGDACGYTRYSDYYYSMSTRTMMKAAGDLGLSVSGTVADVFTHSNTKPSDEIIAGAKNIAASDSRYPVYMWYEAETKTIYWWSEAGKVTLPQRAKYLFWKFPAKKVVLEGLDASTANDMYGFFELSKVQEVVFGDNFDTSRVYDMGSFFSSSNLKTADFENFDTSYSSYFDYMFNNVSATTLDISSLDLSYGYSFKYMFSNSANLTTVILPDTTWDSDGQDFTAMFKQDAKIEVLDLSPLKYDTEYGEVCPSDVRDMFSYMTKLTTIYADPSFDFHDCGYDWTEPGFPPGENDKTEDYDIFWKDDLLVGGAGSVYKDVRPRGDYPYAGYDSYESGWYEPANEVILFRIDGGTTYTRGVFTAKP